MLREITYLLCLSVSHSSRYFHWKLQLYIMLFTEIVVLPFYVAYFLVINIRFCEYRCKVMQHVKLS